MFKSLLEVVSVLYDLTTCAMAMESMDSTHAQLQGMPCSAHVVPLEMRKLLGMPATS